MTAARSPRGRDRVAQHWMDGSAIGGELKARQAVMNIIDRPTFTLTLKQPFGLLEFAARGPRRTDCRRSCARPMPLAVLPGR